MKVWKFEEIKQLIKEASNGNIVLEDKTCLDIKSRHMFKCLSCNDYWETSARSIINNKLLKCPYCNGSRYRCETIVKILDEQGIELLNEFKSVKLMNTVKCKVCSHTWETNLTCLKTTKMKCLKCFPVKRYTQEECLNYLSGKNISFCDEKFINGKYEHNLKCNRCNREWKGPLGRMIRTDSGCSSCVHIAERLSSEEIDKMCKDKGVTLIGEYKSILDVYDFKCVTCGCINRTSLSKIKSSKRGCHQCNYKLKYTNEEIINKFKKLGITFLDEYRGMKCEGKNIKYHFKCNKCNYVWSTSISSATKYKYCSCKGIKRRSIEEIKKICASLKIECLEMERKENNALYRFRCKKCNSEWETTLSGVFDGKHRCPNADCKVALTLRGETYVRTIFENYFNKKFVKIKPEWLVNPKTNYRLELDGYCEELNLAFEYNGRQHYELVKQFKMDNKRLKKQKYMDQLKVDRCKEVGVILIIIPEISRYIKKENVKKYVIAELKKHNINL